MARVDKCQSVVVGSKIYSYGETIPYLKWKLDDTTENEIWNAKIVSVSDVRTNNVLFDGEDHNGNFISVNVDMSNVIE